MGVKHAKPSPLALTLLRLHAADPTHIFYGTAALGSMFRESELTRLDAAYQELKQAGLMEDAGVEISYFGTPKSLLRMTNAGVALVQETAG